MPRRYSVTFEKVSVSAVQDLIQLIGPASAQKFCRLASIFVFDVDTTAPTNQELALRLSILNATVTNGSGGSAPTPRPMDLGDTAASATAKANSTTQATTSGSKTTLKECGCNVFAGYEYIFPEFERQPIASGESIVWELITATNGTLTLSGGVTFDEYGG